ncbi:MAG: hypothetical protein HC830_00615 [Bacteroidetes bacterium]|nr:hypothetical protein [Bacteroidota bacterium]
MKKAMLILGIISLMACEEIDMTMLEPVKQMVDTTNTVVTTPTPSVIVTPNVETVTNPDVFNFIYKQDWENEELGLYEYKQFKSDFNNGLYEWGLGERTDVNDPRSCEIVENNSDVNQSKYFRSNFPTGKYGAASGFCMEGELGKRYEEAYFSYNVRFKKGFKFVDGGKLLGLSGGDIVVPTPPDGSQGFVCVMMWEDIGTIQSYIYHHAQTSEYGEGGRWENSQIPVGEWFNITIRVVMNDLGQANGVFEGFINGKLAFSRNHYVFRQIPEMGIHKIQFHSFFGGSGSRYAAVQDEYIDWDDMAVFTYKSGVKCSPRNTVKRSRKNFRSSNQFAWYAFDFRYTSCCCYWVNSYSCICIWYGSNGCQCTF